jgi:hypothetical protein
VIDAANGGHVAGGRESPARLDFALGDLTTQFSRHLEI